MKKQKNKFWLFVFSLCPGAGHMYMGLMRMGLSFMLGFVGMIAVIAITGLDVLAVFPVVLYIYSVFHANNIGGLEVEQFAALEDEYLFGIGEWDTSRFKLNMNRRNRNIAAVVCIVLGISMLWDQLFGMVRSYVGWDNPVMREIYYFMKDDLPRIVIAIAIIWFGVSLLRGRKIDSIEDGRLGEADDFGNPVGMPERNQNVQGAAEQETDRQCTDVLGGEGQNAVSEPAGERKEYENVQEEGE